MSAYVGFGDRLRGANCQLVRQPLRTLQMNLGKLCNQACLHCHVEAGPNKKRENMNRATAERIMALAADCASLETADLTGGAPELNPNFRYLVETLRGMGKQVIDRCNLTVLFEKGQEDTALFLADQQVKVVASLPCYSRENVEKQRGEGVFGDSIRALQNLNELGYGKEESGLCLDLVYNPVGAFLPPPQRDLELEYKKILMEDFGIYFNHLYTITNMPIKRFLFDLKKSGKYDEYMHLLSDNFNVEAAQAVMCRSLISIGWDGKIYDCDFNQMLDIPAVAGKKDVFSIDSFEEYNRGPIAIADHCLGCTAGAGSSCGGEVVSSVT